MQESEELKRKIKALSDIQHEQAENVTPIWFYQDDNGKQAVGDLGLANEILSENKMITFDAFKEGYRYDKKLGHWRIGYLNYLGSVIVHKLQDVGYWKPKTFNSTQLLITKQIYSDTTGNVFDHSKPNLVAFKNGTYDINTDQIKPNDPNDYILNGHNYDLDMESDTPTTDQWFKESFQDADVFMKEFIGYMFYRSYEPFQKFVILRGSGDDGKSTFLNYVRTIIGDSNTANVDLKGLSGNEAKFNTSTLYGKEVNYFADISKDYLKDSSTIKTLTGNDYMKAEFKGKDPFTFRSYAKLIFSANELPTFTDFTKGFLRRVALVKYHFIPDFADKFNMQQIEDEAPAFAYKCMTAFKKALDQKELSETPDMKAQSDKWLKDNDHISSFVSDMCVIDLDNENGEPAGIVYDDYVQYCQSHGFKAHNQQSLTSSLESFGIIHKRRKQGEERVMRYIHLSFKK